MALLAWCALCIAVVLNGADPATFSRERLIATRRQGIQGVTRRQGCASRRGRCAVADPGARVMVLFLPPPGMVALVLQAGRPPAAAVARRLWANGSAQRAQMLPAL